MPDFVHFILIVIALLLIEGQLILSDEFFNVTDFEESLEVEVEKIPDSPKLFPENETFLKLVDRVWTLIWEMEVRSEMAL